MTSREEKEYNLALAWFEGRYDQEGAKLSAQIQGLDFNRVKNEYGNIYAECEAISNEIIH